MLVILINLVATFGLCLYLSNGQLMLFQPGGIKNVLERLKSTVKEEEKEGEDPEIKTVPIKEAFQNFIHNKRMWVFAAIVAVVSFAFYIWRQFEVVNAPFLNLKYMLLLYLFMAAAIVDAHYSIIPNQLIAVGILYWILLCAFAIFVERQSLLTVLAFSGQRSTIFCQSAEELRIEKYV